MSELRPWITELRNRLSEPPARRFDLTSDRQLLVLPVFVDSRELWAMLIRRPEEIGSIVEVGLPAAVVSEATDPWSSARAAAAMELGISEEQALPLGTLDEVVSIEGRPTLTCVVAIPHPLPSPAEPAERTSELLPMPLTALANPRLVEEQTVEIGGEERSFLVLHLGRRRIAGSVAAAVQKLLERLDMVGPIDAGQ